MNIDFIVNLEHCVEECESLLRLLRSDQEHISNCLDGEILTVYEDYIKAMIKTVEQQKRKLVILLEKQKAGLL